MRTLKTILLLTAVSLMSLSAAAHPTMSGRVKSFSGQQLTIVQEDDSVRVFNVTQGSGVSLRPGTKVSVEVLGNMNPSKPMKAGKIVSWANSSEIVAKGAKAPYSIEVGDYPTPSGTGGIPAGAPVGAHSAPSSILGTVGHGGSGNMPTVGTPSNPASSSTLGTPTGTVQYRNQGEAQAGPLEMMQFSP